MTPGPPVLTAHLFQPIHESLCALLAGLEPAEWARPTRAGSWRVFDVAAHLLDGDLRRLSLDRDGAPGVSPESPVETYRELLGFLDNLNATWVRAARRLSPRMLVDLLAHTGPQVAAFFAGLDPQAPARWPVAWAGEHESSVWFDVGRDYTERWHHQQQIREAVGAPDLTDTRWLRPVIALSMHALRRSFQAIDRPGGTTIAIGVRGDSGGDWMLVRREAWSLESGPAAARDAALRVTLDEEAAWRLFFNQLPAREAERRVDIAGDPSLGAAFLATRAVMV